MLHFGDGAIRQGDWSILERAIREYQVKSVLEFGCGYSTLLFRDLVETVISYETKQGWIEAVLKECPGADIRLWDGVSAPAYPSDLAFVDGPAGGHTRQNSFRIAAESSNLVAVHDSPRKWETLWISIYLEGYTHVMGNQVTTVWRKIR